MSKVGLEHLEQYNQLLRYVFQVTDQELQEIGWQEKEMIRAKSPTLERADVIGWFDRDQLISQVAIYPMRVRIFNQTYDMGGVTGVGTYPEYANQGLMHKLLIEALKHMKIITNLFLIFIRILFLITDAKDGRLYQIRLCMKLMIINCLSIDA